MTAFRMELRRNRSLTLWLGLTLFGYGAIMGLMYPIMAESNALMQEYMKMFPEEFLAAFGMTGSLSDPGVFFTTYVGSWLWPIMAAATAMLLGTRVAADLDRGFLDLPLATPVSRVRYLGASVVGQAIAMVVLAVATVWGIWLVGNLVGADFDPARWGLATVFTFAFGCAVAGPTTLLAVLTLSRGRASGIVAGVMVVMYLIFVVAQISADWAWIAPLSMWNHFDSTALIDEGSMPWGDLALFVIMAAGGWIGAIVAFRRRDLAA
jgi:ABC-2 type transport system permease protein